MESTQQIKIIFESQESTQLSKKQSNNSKKRRMKWTTQENKLYLNFIRQYKQTLELTKKGQKQFIYNKMALYIGTRNSRNCKSHHQKLIDRFQTIENILKVQDQHGKIQNFGRKQRIGKSQYLSKKASNFENNSSIDSWQIRYEINPIFDGQDSQIFIQQDSQYVFPNQQSSLYGILEI